MLSEKLFMFNASSFTLEDKVETLFRSRGAISLDFGSSAYINSDIVPAILTELLEKPLSSANEELVMHLKAELVRAKTQCQKMAQDGANLASRLKSVSTEKVLLNEQLINANKTIESLKSEIAQLRVIQKNASQSISGDGVQYERVLREYQQLKAQSVEAITSLKVLEDENEELRQELDALKGQAKVTPAPKYG